MDAVTGAMASGIRSAAMNEFGAAPVATLAAVANHGTNTRATTSHASLYMGNHNPDGVDVFDVSGMTPTYIATVAGLHGAEGIAAPDVKRGFVANTLWSAGCHRRNAGSATDNTVVASIQVSTSSLAVEYDLTDHKVYLTARRQDMIGVVDTNYQHAY